MTLKQFKAALASIPENIPVSKYIAEKTTLPRVVWNETYYRSATASNTLDDLEVTVVVEVDTAPEDQTALFEVMRALRDAEIPFQGNGGWDEDNHFVSTDLTVLLTMSINEVLENE